MLASKAIVTTVKSSWRAEKRREVKNQNESDKELAISSFLWCSHLANSIQDRTVQVRQCQRADARCLIGTVRGAASINNNRKSLQTNKFTSNLVAIVIMKPNNFMPDRNLITAHFLFCLQSCLEHSCNISIYLRCIPLCMLFNLCATND